MIIISILIAVLATGMFLPHDPDENKWKPKYIPDYKPPEVNEEILIIRNPNANIEIKEKTIHIPLEGLDLQELERLEEVYHNTPLQPLITLYINGIEAEKERIRREEYTNKLISKGYVKKLLEPLEIGTLEKILDDLK